MPRNRRRRLVLGRPDIVHTPPAFQAAGTASSAATAGAFSLAWPTHQANDIGLAFFETANQPIATPSGWNAITNGSQGIGTAGSVTGTCLQVFWRRAVGAAESAISISGAANTGDHVIGNILTVRGCVASGDPVDVSVGDTTTDADTTAVSIPGATTTVAQTLVVAAVSNQVDNFINNFTAVTNASLVSPTVRDSTQTNTGNGGGLRVITGAKATAGAYDATTATHATASRQGRVSFALKPA